MAKYMNVVHSRKVKEKWFNNQVGKLFVNEDGSPDKLLLESIPTQDFNGWLKLYWPKDSSTKSDPGDESPF